MNDIHDTFIKYSYFQTQIHLLLLAFLCSLGCQESLPSSAGSASPYSRLWGKSGEYWTPQSRLPNCSFAGYQRGEKALPDLPPTHHVKEDFGAVGDGETDDTSAFLRAIAEIDSGVLFIPPGKYKITQILSINRSNIVLKGAGTDQTILFFPNYLNDIRPHMSATTSGRPTSSYSWSGGFVWMRGSYQSTPITSITAPAQRGDQVIRVSTTGPLRVGMEIDISQEDNSDNSLATHIYSGDPGRIGNLSGRTRVHLTTRITAIEGNQITLDRPLSWDIEAKWKPIVNRFAPTVKACGIESLAFEFPLKPYGGHFTELGYNAIALSEVVHCWVSNVKIRNADSGIFASGRFCTFSEVVFESERRADFTRNSQGHHGIYLLDDDNLFTRFDFRCRFVHDISVSHCRGNVISVGKGIDLCLDHHKRAPYENVFTDIDAGRGSRLWRSGGGFSLGRHCAARGTFWNIRTQNNQSYPDGFGPASMNIVALTSRQASHTSQGGKWFEHILPSQIQPKNIHQAQLFRRLNP